MSAVNSMAPCTRSDAMGDETASEPLVQEEQIPDIVVPEEEKKEVSSPQGPLTCKICHIQKKDRATGSFFPANSLLYFTV